MSSKTAESPDSRPTVFISYSHQDEVWKDRLVGHLEVLELEGKLDIWEDRRISVGSDWLPEIEKAMDRAAVAVLLISKDFLRSAFIRGTEVRRLLERCQREGLKIIPLFVRPCAWQAVDWLAGIQGRPKDGKALSKVRSAQADEHLSALVLEIQAFLNEKPALPHRPTSRPLRHGGGGQETKHMSAP